MKRIGLGCIALAGLILPGLPARTQTSLDVLEQDLNHLTQQHQEASSEVVSNLLGTLENAAYSPDSALNLYQASGGKMPAPSPVVSKYENETPDERNTRLAKDAAKISTLANIAQIHCGLMRFAALFVIKPDTQGLQDEWVDWLRKTAPRYAELEDAANLPEEDAKPSKDSESQDSESHHHKKQAQEQSAGNDQPVEKKPTGEKHVAQTLMKMDMKDSIISQHLNFYGWGDTEQGQWAFLSLPKLYRKEILDPLRAAHQPEELAAWDVYIAMSQADEPDPDKWAHVGYPSLAFEKDCDDFNLSPSTDKLATLVALLKTCPDHPKIADMTARVHQMLQDYRTQKAGGGIPSGASDATTPSTPGGPTVTVTTTTSGDATVVTTTTNAPPAAPTPPKP